MCTEVVGGGKFPEPSSGNVVVPTKAVAYFTMKSTTKLDEAALIETSQAKGSPAACICPTKQLREVRALIIVKL